MTAVTAAAEKLRNRIAAMTDAGLCLYYEAIARKLETSPRGKGSGEHILILGMMDAETTKRDIPCCPGCSVPLRANWHATSLHDTGSPADQLADALTESAITVARVAR